MENNLKNRVPETVNSPPIADNLLSKALTNSQYAALVTELAPLTITRDQAALIHALLSYRSASIDDEIKRQSSLFALINTLQ